MPTINSTYTAKVEHIAGSTTVLSNVQDVTISQGRANLSDQYKSARMTISGRVPSGLPNIKIGDQIKVTVEAKIDGVAQTLPSYLTVHTGRVADLVIEYGIVPSLDTWTITTEDAIAVLGRAVVSLSVAAGTVTGNAAKQITDAVGVTMTIAGSSIPSISTVKVTTFDKSNALDAFQTYANTEMAFVVQQGDELLWVPRKGWTYTGSIETFSDEVPGDPSDLRFQSLQVSNLADTVAEVVVIAIRDGATVSAGTGNTYVEFNTYDSSSAQATSLAQFIKALFTNDEPVPYQLSYLLTGQSPSRALQPTANELRQVTLKFRGTTNLAIVLGYTLSITPDLCRATLNLLDINQIPIFTLDTTTNGVLDVNVLGY